MINAVTAIMEYSMPLVDDLLTELENYLWFCSLDAASGFWAIMMTMRARKISAFVCALGHFEWLRMPFGISVSFTKSIFCLSKVDFLSHEVSPEGIRADPKKMTAITKLPFPK
ncbi:hypothetical protein PHMEG_00035195 [Phytophthora megakarya]|uniref:Reverse transcriptase domain-containing protein n=1 Tax=Phytophthora megakarya TaxID=4795 RepID=A0A225UPN1_9STRA|nr:hypothetical protein PHMEG_00035195 [Phytophthora megakarya]